MILPTQKELATLAAAIQLPADQSLGDEQEFRANCAFDLWRVCGNLLAAAPASVAAQAVNAEARRLFYSNFLIPRDSFLKAARPGKSITESREKWRAFRKVNTSDRTECLPLEGLHIVAAAFLSFIEREAGKNRTTKARKGARRAHGHSKEFMARLEADLPGQWEKNTAIPQDGLTEAEKPLQA